MAAMTPAAAAVKAIERQAALRQSAREAGAPRSGRAKQRPRNDPLQDDVFAQEA